MLIDLLSTDNLANYNIKIAQVMGLHSAIYSIMHWRSGGRSFPGSPEIASPFCGTDESIPPKDRRIDAMRKGRRKFRLSSGRQRYDVQKFHAMLHMVCNPYTEHHAPADKA